jgi:peptidoglycan hydrolase-like protein with peptidoglycan-binding domain
MRKLIMATASVLALGLATSGASFAQQGNAAQPAPSNEMHQPAANMPSGNMPSGNMPSGNMQTPANAPNQPSNAATQSGMQQGEQMQPQGAQSTAPVRVSRQQVKQVQQKLKTAGLYKGGIDGVMGPETRQAIMQFQKQNGLRNTGSLNQQTLAALTHNRTNGEGSNMAPGAQPSNAGVNNPNAQSGASGNMNQPASSNQR